MHVQGRSDFLQFFVVHDCTVHWQKERRDKEDERDGSFFNILEAKLGIENNENRSFFNILKAKLGIEDNQ